MHKACVGLFWCDSRNNRTVMESLEKCPKCENKLPNKQATP